MGSSLSVLLLSDGRVSDFEMLIEAMRLSRSRIFAIGVGYAPDISALARIAEQTGGTAEVVYPADPLAEGTIRAQVICWK